MHHAGAASTTDINPFLMGGIMAVAAWIL
jgi:hypothetical protein